MSVPAHHARMEQNATTGPMDLSVAVLKVRASEHYSKTCQWIAIRLFIELPRQKINHSFGLVFVKCSVYLGSHIALDVCRPSRLT